MGAPTETLRLPAWPRSWMGRWQRSFVFQRRTRVLAEILAAQIPAGASVLDIGCGDGTIGSLIAQLRPDISLQGVEFMVRPGCKIACRHFDGNSLPFQDRLFDVCLFVDVLHHTQDPSVLLREAARVSRSFVLIKDHLDENAIANLTRRFIDWRVNPPPGAVLTVNHQSRREWSE